MEVGFNGSFIVCNTTNGSLSSNDTLDGVEKKTKVELYIIVLILSIICLMGTIGNATSFYIYFKRRDKSTSVIFILALAGMDFLTCLVIVPYTIVFELLEYELCYDILCKLYLFLITSNIPFSAYIMTAIAFDRYFCICHPFFKAFTVVRAKIIVWCLACLTFTFGVITSLSYGTYAYESTVGEGDYDEDEGYAYFMANDTLNDEYVTDNIIYYGGCHQNGILISINFINSYYQKFYSASFIVAFVIVMVLYIMIYHSILMRRAKKAKRRKKTNYTNVTLEDTTPTNTNNMLIVLKPMNGDISKSSTAQLIDKNKDTSKQKSKRSNTAKDTTLIANIRTALTLFVVTIVFIIAFLPSFLMAHDLLPFNMVVFYLYFSYNVANPFIYAFLNQTFRGDLKNIIKMCK